MVEAKLAEAMAVLNVLKASGPFSLNGMEKWRVCSRAAFVYEVRERDLDAFNSQEHLS